MDLHKFINETMKVRENELMDEPDVETAGAPEVNDELVGNLSNDIPELKDVDQDELRKGLATEMEHFDTVGGDVNMVAKITLDHLQEFPGQKYYTALEQLESELSKAEEQEVAPAPAAEPVSEPAAEEPAVETEAPVEEPVAMESKTSEAKVSEETVEMGKAAIAKEEKMEDAEVAKGKAANVELKV